MATHEQIISFGDAINLMLKTPPLRSGKVAEPCTIEHWSNQVHRGDCIQLPMSQGGKSSSMTT